MKSKESYSFIGITSLLLIAILFFSFKNNKGIEGKFTHHSVSELTLFGIQELSTDTNTLFAASGNCVLCHGDPSQFPSSSANTDSLGEDISPVTYWRATMMANSAKDPFWRAKVKHETIENPDLSNEIETLCSRCHAPNGNFNAIHNGEDYYTIQDLIADPMGQDGVSCTSCHSIEDIDLGVTFSGDITYNSEHEVYGPFTDPFQMPMINNIGFTPLYSSHISSSEACGKCHSLMTETIDESGEFTGNTFPEQAVYHEWLNSNYPDENIGCVGCHMPNANESVTVSPMPPWLDARSPFLKHELVGGNVFMLTLLKDNIEDLDLNASEEQFDDLIERSTIMIQERSLELDVLPFEITNDSIIFQLELQNKAGHKLPSGYPSRKMMIEFLVKSFNEDTLFHSGGFDDEGRIRGELDSEFEPHYDFINSEDQVQIYEYVIGNEEQEITTILTRAYNGLKDNRVPPIGFSSEHASYDTIMIIGAAEDDLNFNIENEIEGSGVDKISYKVPFDDNSDGIIVNVKVHYIAVPRKWLDQMFEHDETEITTFQSMYNDVEERSVIMKEVEFIAGINSIESEEEIELTVYPNPSSKEVNINSKTERITRVLVIDMLGNIVLDKKEKPSTAIKVMLPERSGNYLIIIEFENGQKLTKSVVRL